MALERDGISERISEGMREGNIEKSDGELVARGREWWRGSKRESIRE